MYIIKKFIFLLLLLILNASILFAYTDSDMDGVDDTIDKCPNTPLSDLVNTNGCTIEKLGKNFHFDVIYGLNYADSNDQMISDLEIPAFSLRFDLYYNNFSFTASSSYYMSIDKDNETSNGLYDTYLGASYKLKPHSDILVNMGLGAILPTYDSKTTKNNTDYKAFANVSYMKRGASIFGGYSYTLINDEVIDSTWQSYQDTANYNLGIGYNFSTKFYMSAAYSNTDSIYKGAKDLETASFYGYYSVDRSKFFAFNYGYAISKQANSNSITLLMGYYF